MMCYPKQYLGGQQMDKRTVIGMSIDKVKDQYILCQSTDDENVYYSYYISYTVSNFFNRKHIKVSKVYVLTVKNGSVVDIAEIDALKLHPIMRKKHRKISATGTQQPVLKLMARDFQSVM